jgi:hypothetical protein
LTRPRRKRGDDSEDDSEEEEEESEEEEEDDDQPGGKAGPSTGIVEDDDEDEEPELSRAERKALKKQKKQGPTVDEEDKDLINPNRLPVKAMAISDLKTPRELSRRERYVLLIYCPLLYTDRQYEERPRRRPSQRRDTGSTCTFDLHH